MRKSKPTVIVIGAGIVGASVAYHLARRDAAVTLVERSRPACGVTGKAFAWINVAHGIPGIAASSAALRRHAIQDYHRLDRELNHVLPITWSGALTWNRDPTETERFAREQAAWGYDVRLVERGDVAKLEPNLKDLPQWAAFAADEGAVEPVGATEILVKAARDAGADIRLSTEVVTLSTDDARVTGVHTAEGELEADLVVIAAGSAAPALTEPIGITLPVASSPAILMRFRTTSRLVNCVLSNPFIEIRQASDTVLLGAEDYLDASGDNGPEAIARRALAAVRRQFKSGSGVEYAGVEVGNRPMPRDNLPIIGHVPQIEGLYLSVMHAGVTLAPIAGRLATTEILDEITVGLLEPCRSQRFQI